MIEKICDIAQFTRATPGSSLVMYTFGDMRSGRRIIFFATPPTLGELSCFIAIFITAGMLKESQTKKYDS